MNQKLLEELRQITPEEQMYLNGAESVDEGIYMEPKTNVVDYKKLITSGKVIDVRTHTRFVHFPKHTHNYVELIYMCSGSTKHIINGSEIVLEEGELLFLNQNAIQEIMPAGENDIAVNLIILPSFFDYALTMLGDEDNLIREFIIDCLKSKDNDVSYLHFKVADVLPIQNLMENLIWTIHNKQNNKRSINQATMGLLLLQLMNYTEYVDVGKDNSGQELVMSVYKYVEENYRDGSFTDLAEQLHYDLHWLSKTIKQLTGKNYTELLQDKRMRQAAYLLRTSRLTVADIATAVGYENISYFHRLFQKTYGTSPRNYRLDYSTESEDI
ncbi:MAG: helix-turn-helix domain-containing protein [Lachnospiraceae bacterium]|nr:helix-turn-helix domain-containing protein [Lachnospiraceae bacterium]MBQ4300194.1 helix-turn-helix domain-containing protein [Lachnospiraceae bacterium]